MSLTPDQESVLQILQAHNGTHTFECDEAYQRVVPSLKMRLLVQGGGHFHHDESNTTRETLVITLKGGEALDDARRESVRTKS